VTIRTQRRTIEFRRAFLLKGIDRILPPGKYDIVSDEELIEGLSFPVYRRVSTIIFVPAAAQASAIAPRTGTPAPLNCPPPKGLQKRTRRNSEGFRHLGDWRCHSHIVHWAAAPGCTCPFLN
jgi:hypothetical protein